MQIKVSKVFANFINKTAKELGFEAEASVKSMSEGQYRMLVGDPYDADYYGDYDWKTGQYKAIKVVYPYEYYACPQFLSTHMLYKTFQQEGFDGTFEMAKEIVRGIVEI